jgi:hypothetical protein
MSVEDDHREGDLFAAYSEGLAEGAAAERDRIVALLEQLRDGYWLAGSRLNAGDERTGHYYAGQALKFAASVVARSASPVAAVVGQPEDKET